MLTRALKTVGAVFFMYRISLPNQQYQITKANLLASIQYMMQ